MTEFTPKIIAFVCNWCSYAGADAAGGRRLSCPAEVKLVRIMCTGRIDPQFVMTAFRDGADGVIVMGCHPGECHYRDGNLKAQRRFRLFARLLADFGIDAERFRLEWVGAAEAERFQQVTTEMTAAVRRLGPLHLRGAVEGQT